MAVSVAIKDTFPLGRNLGVVAEVTFDSSYPAGGEAVTGADFSLTSITHIIGGVARDPDTKAFAVDYDADNGKLVLFASADSATDDSPLLELSGLSTPITDASAYTVRVFVIGPFANAA